jgi:glutathione synthase/RimK-type ligase-like ATP-grasp enzyme
LSNKILILTNSEDGEHTDSVIRHLQEAGYPYFRLDVDMVARGETGISVRTGPSGVYFELATADGNICKSAEVTSVWYRRPYFYRSPIKDQVQRNHAEKELDSLFEGMWRTLDRAFWLNSPVSLEQTRKKTFQLHLASSVGLQVPRTLVTNNPDEARNFVASCESGAVFKNINTGFLDYGDEAFVVPTTPVQQHLLDNISLIKRLPGLFQERVAKAYELRVTIVGEFIFPVFINSQKYEETSCDWRNKLDYREAELPENVRRQLLKLMDLLGIKFGAFDLAVDPNGEYWFFEVNGNGQWYWLEHETGLLISKSISDTLIKEASTTRG